MTNKNCLSEKNLLSANDTQPLQGDKSMLCQIDYNPNELPQPWPQPIASARFKSIPTDFKVNEIMDIALSGEGEHLWLQVKKTGTNTAYVAEQLAKWAKIPKRDVGYSGMKDRQAETTQWFSLRLPKKQMPEITFKDYLAVNSHNKHDTEERISEKIQVIKQNWHNKKLNRGTHRANHFMITLRNIELNHEICHHVKEIENTLDVIAKNGVPNYFGPQRFGKNGNNINQALEWFKQGTINGRKPHPKKSRDLQSILLSSARSAIFNQILAQRVIERNWNTGVDGEVFNLAGSASVFAAPLIDDTLRQRVSTGDIHPTASLWGVNNTKVQAEAKAIEDKVVSSHTVLLKLAEGLEGKKVKTMRRPLRLTVTDLTWTWQKANNKKATRSDKLVDGDDGNLNNDSDSDVNISNHELINLDNQLNNGHLTLILQFTLPTGTFATSVLASIINELIQTEH